MFGMSLSFRFFPQVSSSLPVFCLSNTGHNIRRFLVNTYDIEDSFFRVGVHGTIDKFYLLQLFVTAIQTSNCEVRKCYIWVAINPLRFKRQRNVDHTGLHIQLQLMRLLC